MHEDLNMTYITEFLKAQATSLYDTSRTNINPLIRDLGNYNPATYLRHKMPKHHL